MLEKTRRGTRMLFERQSHTLRRLLIVEDEPLVAFDNEHVLTDAGYQVVATVDGVAEAISAIESEQIDLVLADLRLSDGDSGIDVARAAHAHGVPVLFVSGHCPEAARQLAVGCLAKPFRPRDLLDAINAVEAHLGRKKKSRAPEGLTLYS
jgi:two-component system, response regulator PdtaR